MPIPLWNRIAFRQTVTLLAAGLAIGVVISGLQVARDVEKTRHDIASTVRDLMRLVESSAATAAYNLDPEASRAVVDGLVGHAYIRRAEIIDDFGSILTTREAAAEPGPISGAAFFLGISSTPYEKPIFAGKDARRVGTLRVFVNDQDIARRALGRVAATFTGGIVFMLLLAAVLLLLIYRSTTAPVLRITEHLAEVDITDPGRVHLPPPLYHEKDELGLLASTINAMLGRIRSQNEAIRSNEERLQLQIRRMPVGCIFWNTGFKVEMWNPAAEKIFGYAAAEALGKHPYEIIVPREAQPAVDDVWRRLLEGDETAHSVNENFKKDGTTILCKWTNTPIRNGAGVIIGVLSMVEDVTELKKAEENLLRSEWQLRQIIDAVPHMIFAKNRDGKFLLANKALAVAYGKPLSEIVGKNNRDIHPVASEVERFLGDDREVITSGQVKLIAAQPFTDASGKVRMLQTIKMPFEAVGIDEPAVLGVAVDVTEQKKIEEFRNDIIRTISHELRTPLSIEKEGVALLLEEVTGPVNPAQRGLLEAVMRNIDRLSRMINSLLDISNIEAGKLQLKKENVDLMDLARRVVLDFKNKAAARGIDLATEFPEEKVVVQADADKIEQVLTNLIDNSLKFIEKGSVRVTVKRLKHEVECSVQDTGIGIAPENVAKMFEKFQQFAYMAGPGEKGLGLGLSICRGIIETHRGRIWAKSRVGEGTQVTFTLPIPDGDGPG